MIKIALPNPNDFSSPLGTAEERAKGIKSFLRQLELSVHHMQKSVEQMEKDGLIGDDSFITFRHPLMDLYGRESDENGFVKVHVDEEMNQMLDIELEVD